MHQKKEQADSSAAPPYHTITLKYVLDGGWFSERRSAYRLVFVTYPV